MSILDTLVFLASIAFLVAVYYCYKLSKETKHEKYWLILTLGFFVFAVHHWMMIPWSFGFISDSLQAMLEQVSSIIGASLIAYAIFGLYTSMRRINQKLK